MSAPWACADGEACERPAEGCGGSCRRAVRAAMDLSGEITCRLPPRTDPADAVAARRVAVARAEQDAPLVLAMSRASAARAPVHASGDTVDAMRYALLARPSATLTATPVSMAPAFPGSDTPPPAAALTAGARVQLRPKVWDVVRVGKPPFAVHGGTPERPLPERVRYGTVVELVRRVMSPTTAHLNGVTVSAAAASPLIVVTVVEHDDGVRRGWGNGALWALAPGDDPALKVATVPMAARLVEDDADFTARRKRGRIARVPPPAVPRTPTATTPGTGAPPWYPAVGDEVDAVCLQAPGGRIIGTITAVHASGTFDLLPVHPGWAGSPSLSGLSPVGAVLVRAAF